MGRGGGANTGAGDDGESWKRQEREDVDGLQDLKKEAREAHDVWVTMGWASSTPSVNRVPIQMLLPKKPIFQVALLIIYLYVKITLKRISRVLKQFA